MPSKYANSAGQTSALGLVASGGLLRVTREGDGTGAGPAPLPIEGIAGMPCDIAPWDVEVSPGLCPKIDAGAMSATSPTASAALAFGDRVNLRIAKASSLGAVRAARRISNVSAKPRLRIRPIYPDRSNRRAEFC
jgi:hypothetical protein